MEFPELRKRYWGRRFWVRGYFSTTSGNVTHDIILQYLELHSKRDATGVSR
jgi:putative transposase